MSDEKNEIEEIGEEALEKVAGGVGADSKCWFKSDAGWASLSLDNRAPSVKCEADCFYFLTQCKCHGSEHCVNKMHVVDYVETKIHLGANPMKLKSVDANIHGKTFKYLGQYEY